MSAGGHVPFTTRTGEQLHVPLVDYRPQRVRGGYSQEAFLEQHRSLTNLINETNPWLQTFLGTLQAVLVNNLRQVQISNAVILGSGSPSEPTSLAPGGSGSEPAENPSPISEERQEYLDESEPIDTANTQLAFFQICCRYIALVQGSPAGSINMFAQDIVFNTFDKRALQSIGITYQDHQNNQGLSQINETTFVMAINITGPLVVAAYIQRAALCLTADMNGLFEDYPDLSTRYREGLLREYDVSTRVIPPPQTSPLYLKIALDHGRNILAWRRPIVQSTPPSQPQKQKPRKLQKPPPPKRQPAFPAPMKR